MLKKLSLPFIIGISSFFIIYIVSEKTIFFDRLQYNIQDAWFYLREPGHNKINPYVSDRVKLLGIDEDSAAVIGRWPWKRNVHSEFLHDLEQFSPESVLFDILFVLPEAIPTYVSEKLRGNPGARKEVFNAFRAMDNELAKAFEKYDNVYIDLRLVEQSRPYLPESVQKRIAYTEQFLYDYSLPLEKNGESFAFLSLEPIMENYVRNAHPVVVNLRQASDNVVRSFPLYFTYKMSSGELRNVFTVELSLLKKYYRVEKKNIKIERDKVVLSEARVPILDPLTRQEKLYTRELIEILSKINNPRPPRNYDYNKNFYYALYNDLKMQEAEGEAPLFPLHVVISKDEPWQVVDSWEVLDAARAAQSKNIEVVFYQVKDLEIKTPVFNDFYINFSGRERTEHRDVDTGESLIHTPIPTESYTKVHGLGIIPDLPAFKAKREMINRSQLKKTEKWFLEHCATKVREVFLQAQAELGELKDDAQLIQYLNENPDLGKYFYYHQFLAQASPGEFRSTYPSYPDFANQMGQPAEYYLDEKAVVSELNNFYLDQFEKYHNRYIFVGAYTPGIGDVKQTPYGPMFGINVIINAFSTIITQNELLHSEEVPFLDLLLLLFLCLLTTLIYSLLKVNVNVFVFILWTMAIFFLSAYFLITQNFVLKTPPLLFSNTINFIAIIVIKLVTEEKDKKFIKSTFASYLSPEVIDTMCDNKTIPTLGGESKVLTAFFTDIQGFSTFSEKLAAPQLVELLNEYLSDMTEILLKEQGTLDKYEGDAIIAFIGAPMDLPDHAYRACRIAVEMQRRLSELCKKWKQDRKSPNEASRNIKKLPPEEWGEENKWPSIVHNMRMRIGFNSGEIVIGNMGSTRRMNYTMMGDSVNLAARLETGSKQYGIYTVASEFTLDSQFEDEQGKKIQVKDLIESRFIDRIIVMGKTEPVSIYEILALKGEITNEERELLDIFAKGRECYLNMNWDDALKYFQEASALERFKENEITPSKVYIDRCENFKHKPPVGKGEKWDGVYRLASK